MGFHEQFERVYVAFSQSLYVDVRTKGVAAVHFEARFRLQSCAHKSDKSYTSELTLLDLLFELLDGDAERHGV